VQSELGKPTFSTIGKTASGVSIDRVTVDIAGLPGILDQKAEELKQFVTHSEIQDENLQSLAEGVAGIVACLDKIALMKPAVHVAAPVLPAPEVKVETPVHLKVETPKWVYTFLLLQAGALWAILIKLFLG
jgi:hypothetical protein